MGHPRIPKTILAGFVLMLILSHAWGEDLKAAACTVVYKDDGHVLVVLESGADVFLDAFPAVRYRGESKPVPMVMPPSRAHVEQKAVTGPLGAGTLLSVTYRGSTWELTSYAGKPYFTAQATYKNTGSEPKKIKSLVPWASHGACTLGTGTNRAAILDNGSLFVPQAMLKTSENKDVVSLWNLAAHNPGNGRSLIVGFLTNQRAYAQIQITRDTDLDATAFALLQAECRYDPPIELAPGESLASEIVYISVGETSPLIGLEHFADSVATFNNLKPTRHALPHGWDSWVSHYHKNISEEEMLAELDVQDKHLKRYGWTHFSIDDGWQKAAGDWKADPERFPSGMKAFADKVHGRGMTAGLWTEPFTAHLDSSLAKAHPEWLAKPGLMGKSMLGEDERILDITAPGAYGFVKDIYSAIVQEWGYDALVETDFVYHLLAAKSYADSTYTHAQALCRGMQAIRDGAGEETFIMGVAPFPLVGYIADGMRVGIDCAPIWRTTPDLWSWGCVDALTNAARRYYFAPRVFALDQDCFFFGHESTRKRWKVEHLPHLTRNQQLAWMTGAALTGGAVKSGDAYTTLTPEELDMMRRLLPVITSPARPVDLFEREEARIWSLPIDCAIGKWRIVGVFNWNASEDDAVTLSLSQLGLDADTEYAVFDFWQQRYCGLAKGQMNLPVPAGSVRLLSFRPYEKRPMFLATDSHFTQGATDFKLLEWSSQDRILSGRFEGIEETDYVLSILTPEGYTPSKTVVSVPDVEVVQKGKVARLEFHCDVSGPVDWHVRF